jgi:hypothetical protein
VLSQPWRAVLAPLASLSLAGQEHGRTIPLSDIRHAGVSKPLECYEHCVDSRRDILQPIVVAFTQQLREIESHYFRTDALSRCACIPPMD